MSGLLKKLWEGVSIEGYHQIKPLTGRLDAIPSKFENLNFLSFEDWFETIALRAQNDCNIYLDFIFNKWEFETFPTEIKETVVDMIYILIEHWIFNRIPIEFFVDATNNLNTSNMSYIATNLANNMQDMLPQRVKALANFTELKNFLIPYNDEQTIDANMIDLGQYYTKFKVDKLLREENQERKEDVQHLKVSKLDIEKQLELLGYGKLQKMKVEGAIGVKYDPITESATLDIDVSQLGEGIVIDNLNTNSGEDALSARQGMYLNEKIDNKFLKININKTLINNEGIFNLNDIDLKEKNLYKFNIRIIGYYDNNHLKLILEVNNKFLITFYDDEKQYFINNKLELWKFDNEILIKIKDLKVDNLRTFYPLKKFIHKNKIYFYQQEYIFIWDDENLVFVVKAEYEIKGCFIINNKTYISFDYSIYEFINDKLIFQFKKIVSVTTTWSQFVSGFLINDKKYLVAQEGDRDHNRGIWRWENNENNLTRIRIPSYEMNILFLYEQLIFQFRDGFYRFNENEEFVKFQNFNWLGIAKNVFIKNFIDEQLQNFIIDNGKFFKFDEEINQFVNINKIINNSDLYMPFKNKEKNYIATSNKIYSYDEFILTLVDKSITTDFLYLSSDNQYLKIYDNDNKIHEFYLSVKDLLLKIFYVTKEKNINEIYLVEGLIIGGEW